MFAELHRDDLRLAGAQLIGRPWPRESLLCGVPVNGGYYRLGSRVRILLSRRKAASPLLC